MYVCDICVLWHGICVYRVCVCGVHVCTCVIYVNVVWYTHVYVSKVCVYVCGPVHLCGVCACIWSSICVCMHVHMYVVSMYVPVSYGMCLCVE